MDSYTVIPQDWAATMNGKLFGDVVFNSALTTDGRCVCAFSLTYIFLEDFALLSETDWEMNTVDLSQDDFPVDDISRFIK